MDNNYWEVQQKKGKEWQEKRYRENKMVWGTDPGPTTITALSEFRKSNKNIKSVLVIGCGYGRECFYFHKNGLDVTGVDTSVEGIKLAVKWAEELNINNIRFKVDNALNLSFQSESFDGVFLHKVYHQFNEEARKQLLLEINRVLKKDGMLFLSDLSTKDPEFGKGIKIDERTYEKIDRPFRPIYHLSALNLEEFNTFSLIKTNEIDYFETHPGESTEHKHVFLEVIGKKSQ